MMHAILMVAGSIAFIILVLFLYEHFAVANHERVHQEAVQYLGYNGSEVHNPWFGHGYTLTTANLSAEDHKLKYLADMGNEAAQYNSMIFQELVIVLLIVACMFLSGINAKLKRGAKNG
jgi:hypothetical protein